MKISLLTDAPKHNVALMKISQWHKKNGDSVELNMPVISSDFRYASLLFDRNKHMFIADEYGGPAVNRSCLSYEIESMTPDYQLYPKNRFSLGYTYRPCSNTCDFCKVPKMNHPDIDHHSIWGFHDPKFKRICILNNNTFQDPKWKETFEEIWAEDLTVINENGYDLRLIDDEKAASLKKTKWYKNKMGFAWDRMQDDYLILKGLEIAKRHGLLRHETNVYILTGYNTTEDEDIYRCQKIIDFNSRPYIMPFKKTKENMRFKRFIDTFMWRKYKTVKEAWHDYNRT